MNNFFGFRNKNYSSCKLKFIKILNKACVSKKNFLNFSNLNFSWVIFKFENSEESWINKFCKIFIINFQKFREKLKFQWKMFFWICFSNRLISTHFWILLISHASRFNFFSFFIPTNNPVGSSLKMLPLNSKSSTLSIFEKTPSSNSEALFPVKSIVFSFGIVSNSPFWIRLILLSRSDKYSIVFPRVPNVCEEMDEIPHLSSFSCFEYTWKSSNGFKI